MYHILNSITLKCEEKQTEALNVILNWKEIYRLPFITTKSSKLQWFQNRIIHRIHTNSLLYKINQKPNDKCSFCLKEVETIEHIFWSCNKIYKLWEDLNNWILKKTEIELPLNLTIILFGITDKLKKNYVRNLIILLTKFYIYITKLNTEQVHLKALQNYLKENLVIEKKHIL